MKTSSTANINPGELERLDTLERAINLNDGVMRLMCHISDSVHEIDPIDLNALSELVGMTASMLNDLKAAMQAEAGKQGAEYWRGYEDGKAAAAAAAQQKAAIAGE